jgi:hypothetical protein
VKLTKDRQYHGQREADKRQRISWPKGKWQRQTISWPKVKWQKTDNIIAKVKMVLSVFCQLHFGYDIVCLLSLILWPWYCLCLSVSLWSWYCLSLSISLWPWYCLCFVSFTLAMILSVFCQLPFGHGIVCRLSASLWLWYCLSFVSFPLAMVLSWQKTENIMAKG